MTVRPIITTPPGRWLCSLLTLLVASIAPAVASAQTVVPLPQTFTMSPGNVDLRSGNFYNQNSDVSSGDLTLTRTTYGVIQTQSDEWPLLENGFDHSFRIGVKSQRVPRPEGGGSAFDDWVITIHIGMTTYAFKRTYQSNATFVQTGGVKGRTLSWTGGSGLGSNIIYTFTDRDDAKYVFRSTSFITVPDCGASTPCAYVDTIEKPTGERMYFSYDTASSGAARLRLVRNNRGFALGFDYSGLLITKACAINLAITYHAAGTDCPAAVPTATYGYTSGGLTYTQPSGGTYTYGADRITLPGASQPWVTWTVACCNEDGLYVIGRQDFADGSWFTYAPLSGLVTSFTGPNGTTTLQFDRVQRYTTSDPGIEYVVSSGPSSITDPLGRTTLTQYCGSGSGLTCVSPISPVPLSQTMPETNKAIYTNDSFDNPIQVVLKPKSGSTLGDRTVSATYAYSVPGGKTKPLTATDARSAVTNYAYDGTTGQLLSQTSPAVNGVNPKTRYTYVSRQAWLKTSGGGYVADPVAVSVLDTERYCISTAESGAGCVGGASDLVLTTYDYGPNAGPNNLLLRGRAVTASGTTLRTCYGYDAQGNKISETTPRAGLTSCP